MRPSIQLLQRIVLTSERGALRPLWWACYEILARAQAAWLRADDRRASVYRVGSSRPVYGLSDIDLVVVVPDESGAPGRARRRVARRREQLDRRVPWLCDSILDTPQVLEARELATATAAPALTHGLDLPDDADPSRRALYYGDDTSSDRVAFEEKPGLYGPTDSWRRIAGPRHPLARPDQDAQLRRIAGWLELQALWRWLLQAFPARGADAAHLCVKALADPARVWLWLQHGERADGRRDALEQALRRWPEQEVALRAGLALERGLARRPAAPLEEVLPHAIGLMRRIAALMADQVGDAGTTLVGLAWDGPDELALTPTATARLRPILGAQRPQLLPLVDWRALVGAWRPDIAPPVAADETLAPLRLDASVPADLVAAIRAGDDGAYPALRSGELLVLASRRWPRTHLRAVQSALTDPVSFALLEGRDGAAFPNVAGWSAEHAARRAVAEHAAWLAGGEAAGGPAVELPLLVSAARAALFLQTLRDGAPTLTLTAAATLRALVADRSAGVIDDATESYQGLRHEGVAPAATIVSALRDVVVGLAAYRGAADAA